MGTTLDTMSHSTTALVSSIGLVTAIILSPVQKALVLLFIFSALDFITGILASYFKKKELEKKDPSLKEEDLISSEKLKLSLVKVSTYAIGILGCWLIESIFFLKKISISAISEEEMTVTLLCVGFCCIIEFYSIVFENFKAMGFDVRKRVVQVSSNIKKTIKEVKS